MRPLPANAGALGREIRPYARVRKPFGGYAKETANNCRIDWTTGAPPVIARSSCDEATQGPRDAAPGLLRCARNDGLGVGSLVSGRRLSVNHYGAEAWRVTRSNSPRR